MSSFDFQRLDVYRAAIEFIGVTHAIIERLPRGHGYLVDQLQRAATSVALNIAEGAGEAHSAEKVRFYRMARRSAFECAAILDVLATHHPADATELRTGEQLLQRIGAMLTRMTGSGKQPDSDSGAARLDSDSDSESLPGRQHSGTDPDSDAGAARLVPDSSGSSSSSPEQ